MPRLLSQSLLYIALVVLCSESTGKDVAMKIVDEPSSFGFPNQEDSHTNELKMRIQPSNFSGPPHFRALLGKCFEKVDDAYKYYFCPFWNLTQHEQSLRWNPYSGILGIWQEWEIINNTFTAMLMGEGDACGSKQRQTRVIFKCGDDNSVDKVSEPDTCMYELVFRTPFVCHPHSMLVYPTLNSTTRHKWDLLEGQMQNGELTQKGYDKALRRMFESVQYMLPESEKKSIAKEAAEKEQEQNRAEAGEFDTLDKCTEAYKKLQTEVEGLKSLLAVYQANNSSDVKEANHMYEDYLYNEHYRAPDEHY